MARDRCPACGHGAQKVSRIVSAAPAVLPWNVLVRGYTPGGARVYACESCSTALEWKFWGYKATAAAKAAVEWADAAIMKIEAPWTDGDRLYDGELVLSRSDGSILVVPTVDDSAGIDLVVAERNKLTNEAKRVVGLPTESELARLDRKPQTAAMPPKNGPPRPGAASWLGPTEYEAVREAAEAIAAGRKAQVVTRRWDAFLRYGEYIVIVFFDNPVPDSETSAHAGHGERLFDLWPDEPKTRTVVREAIEGKHPETFVGEGWTTQSWWDHPQGWLAKLTFAPLTPG